MEAFVNTFFEKNYAILKCSKEHIRWNFCNPIRHYQILRVDDIGFADSLTVNAVNLFIQIVFSKLIFAKSKADKQAGSN